MSLKKTTLCDACTYIIREEIFLFDGKNFCSIECAINYIHNLTYKKDESFLAKRLKLLENKVKMLLGSKGTNEC
jgi:hypothetical protein